MNLKKIMSATPQEFFRSLVHFSPERSFDTSKNSFSFDAGDGAAQISYKVIPDRRVTGLLSLPQLEVNIDFDNVSEENQEQFIKDFDLAFRRGGG